MDKLVLKGEEWITVREAALRLFPGCDEAQIDTAINQLRAKARQGLFRKRQGRPPLPIYLCWKSVESHYDSLFEVHEAVKLLA